MAKVPLTPKQARKMLRQIVEHYGLDIGDIDKIPTKVVREALRRFDLGLLPDRTAF